MKQFNDMKKMMKQFSGAGRKGKKVNVVKWKICLKGMNLPFYYENIERFSNSVRYFDVY